MRRLNRRLILTASGAAFICIFVVFVVNKNSNGYSDLPEGPRIGECHCPTKQEATFAPEPELKVVSNPNVNRFESCQDTDPNSAVQRAILIYYPHHQSDYFFPEVRW